MKTIARDKKIINAGLIPIAKEDTADLSIVEGIFKTDGEVKTSIRNKKIKAKI